MSAVIEYLALAGAAAAATIWYRRMQNVECPECSGIGRDDDRNCPTCHGDGEVSRHAAAVYLETLKHALVSDASELQRRPPRSQQSEIAPPARTAVHHSKENN